MRRLVPILALALAALALAFLYWSPLRTQDVTGGRSDKSEAPVGAGAQGSLPSGGTPNAPGDEARRRPRSGEAARPSRATARLLSSDGHPLVQRPCSVHFGRELPRGTGEPPTESNTQLRTNDRGVVELTFPANETKALVALPIRDGYALWFRIAPGEEIELRSLPESRLSIRCEGLDPDEPWRLEAYPAQSETPEEGAQRIALEGGDGGGRARHVLSRRELEARGSQVLELPTTRAARYVLFAKAWAHALVERRVLARASDQVRFVAAARTPTLDIRVSEADGVTVSRDAGRVIFGEEDWRLERNLSKGLCRIGWGRLQQAAKCRVWVRMADGEVFSANTELLGDRGSVLQFRRGTGRQPIRLHIRTRGDTPALPAKPLVVVENGNGTWRTAVPAAEQSYFEENPLDYSRVSGSELRLHGVAEGWRQAYVFREDGTGARLLPDGMGGGSGTWLPTRSTGSLGLTGLLAARQARGGTLYFELELRGDRGDPFWLAVDKIPLSPRTQPPASVKRLVPGGLPFRFRLRIPGREEEYLNPDGG